MLVRPDAAAPSVILEAQLAEKRARNACRTVRVAVLLLVDVDQWVLVTDERALAQPAVQCRRGRREVGIRGGVGRGRGQLQTDRVDRVDIEQPLTLLPRDDVVRRAQNGGKIRDTGS